MVTPETDLLRRAAARVREVAGAATPGSWRADLLNDVVADHDDASWDVADLGVICPWPSATESANAAHIALWDPFVALAVAEWLEAEAGALQAMGVFQATVATIEHEVNVRGAALTISKGDTGEISLRADTSTPALALARLILGEPKPAPLVREDSHGSWPAERVGGEE